MAAQFIFAGTYFYGFSAFLLPLTTEFGWSYAAFSGAMSFSRLEGGLLGPLGGFLVDRFGARRMVFLGMGLMGLGFILLTQVSSLLMFYLVFILTVTVGADLGARVPAFTSAGSWFIRRRGLALGLVTMGSGLGGSLVPVLGWMMVRYGWREAAVATGIFVILTGVLIGLVQKERPERYGELPDGGPAPEAEKKKEGLLSRLRGRKKGKKEEVDFTPRQALATSAFWFISVGAALRLMVTSGVAVHLIPFLVSLGVSRELSATILGAMAVVSISGRLGLGLLADFFDKRMVLIAGLGLQLLGILVLLKGQVLGLTIMIALFLLVYAPGYGGLAAVNHAIRGEYFGRRHFGTIMGFMGMVQMAGTISGPVVAGLIWDLSGSYTLAFIVFGIASLLSMLLFLLAKRPSLKPYAVAEVARPFS